MSADHLDLHSFPTRRSSDLVSPRPRGRCDWPSERAARGRTRGASAREDRKSTRLNSSHSSISYAVFCLKKKIEMTSILLRDCTNIENTPAVPPLANVNSPLS